MKAFALAIDFIYSLDPTYFSRYIKTQIDASKNQPGCQRQLPSGDHPLNSRTFRGPVDGSTSSAAAGRSGPNSYSIKP